jgi:pimeloyl-ACP methyl ester carboxylesterase
MRFEHAGVGINWQVDHDGEGTPILFLHGLSGSLGTYDEVVELLAGRGRRIFRIDLRGHGASDRISGTYQVPYYSADVVAFIEHVIGQPAVLVGHSLGGVIARNIAATRPDLVHGALLEDPPLYFIDQKLFDASMFAQVFPLLEQQIRELQARGATLAEARDAAANSAAPWGTASETNFPQSLDARAYSMLAVDPDVWIPAIKGGALSGYDPDAAVSRPLVILQADPAMGPALWPDHADRQRNAQRPADVRLIEGAPHGIHTFRTARDRYMDALSHLLETVK